jgi:AcrR family transcriptional regulator
MLFTDSTREKILASALDLFLAQGIKKTGLEQVAFRAGVSRITVYRYFPDKQQLVLAALMRIPASLEAAQAHLVAAQTQDVDTALDLVSAQFAALSPGDLPTLLDELQRVYPLVWKQVHAARLAAIQGIFNHLFALAENQGCLRTGLNRQVIQAYFIAAVVNVLEGPSLASLGFSTAEVLDTVNAIFLHGILREKQI